MKKAKYCENVECERKKQIKGNKINYEENKAKKKKHTHRYKEQIDGYQRERVWRRRVEGVNCTVMDSG